MCTETPTLEQSLRLKFKTDNKVMHLNYIVYYAMLHVMYFLLKSIKTSNFFLLQLERNNSSKIDQLLKYVIILNIQIKTNIYLIVVINAHIYNSFSAQYCYAWFNAIFNLLLDCEIFFPNLYIKDMIIKPEKYILLVKNDNILRITCAFQLVVSTRP